MAWYGLVGAGRVTGSGCDAMGGWSPQLANISDHAFPLLVAAMAREEREAVTGAARGRILLKKHM